MCLWSARKGFRKGAQPRKCRSSLGAHVGLQALPAEGRASLAGRGTRPWAGPDPTTHGAVARTRCWQGFTQTLNPHASQVRKSCGNASAFPLGMLLPVGLVFPLGIFFLWG